jgi:hypothetical protein
MQHDNPSPLRVPDMELQVMSPKFSTWKVIHGKCEQCKTAWTFEGWDDGKRYKAIVSAKEPKLCKRCLYARRRGEYVYRCDGCDVRVRGRFEDLRDLLNVEGRSFCCECMVAFYGRYDPNNSALMELLANKASRLKRRTFMNLPSDEQQKLFKEAMAYSEVVRRRSQATLLRFGAVLNPHGHKLGRSGARGAYQLDHIIPVLVCWEYGVSEVNASSVGNLQVIPWFVNVSRGGGLVVEHLVGWPDATKNRRARYARG